MRVTLSLAIMALLIGTAGTAMAQNNTSTGGSGYTYIPNSNSSSATIYNSEPMIAGKNAPSYTSSKNKPKPYAFGTDAGADKSGYGMMTPEQANAMRAMRDQQAMQAQQQYLADMQKTGGMPVGSPSLQERMNQLNPMQEEEEQKPKKRRVVYNKKNNESAIGVPPRLFNPDQR